MSEDVQDANQTSIDETSPDFTPESLIAVERKRFHAALIKQKVLAVNEEGVASNADKDSAPSVAVAGHIARTLNAATGARLAGQRAGKAFESVCKDFLAATFPRLGMLRSGDWVVERIGDKGTKHRLFDYEPYRHLWDLNRAIKNNRDLEAILGNGYEISPDVVIGRRPVSEDFVNQGERLIEPDIARLTPMLSRNWTDEERAAREARIIHAVVSCKFTLRSDRAQNARSEALNLIRNRKGRLPHIAVITAEPQMTRLASLALGTGDIDCVYHYALHELQVAVEEVGTDDGRDMLRTLVSGRRLRDISDLPLDLAV